MERPASLPRAPARCNLAIGFVAAPSDRTPVQHLGGLAGNVVYGLTTELVRRLLRD